MYLYRGRMKRGIWNSGGFMVEAGWLCKEGDVVEVYDSPFPHCPLTIEPLDGGRAFCCTAADVEQLEEACPSEPSRQPTMATA